MDLTLGHVLPSLQHDCMDLVAEAIIFLRTNMNNGAIQIEFEVALSLEPGSIARRTVVFIVCALSS